MFDIAETKVRNAQGGIYLFSPMRYANEAGRLLQWKSLLVRSPISLAQNVMKQRPLAEMTFPIGGDPSCA